MLTSLSEAIYLLIQKNGTAAKTYISVFASIVSQSLLSCTDLWQVKMHKIFGKLAPDFIEAQIAVNDLVYDDSKFLELMVKVSEIRVVPTNLS